MNKHPEEYGARKKTWLNKYNDPTFWVWFAGTNLIGLVILNAGYILIFSDDVPSLTVRGVIKGIAGAMLIWAAIFVVAIRNRNRRQ